MTLEERVAALEQRMEELGEMALSNAADVTDLSLAVATVADAPDAPASDKAWHLRSITRSDDNVHEIVFDVDGVPSVKLTVRGSFSLEGCRIEGVVPPA